MQMTAVDNDNNLFRVTDVVSTELVEKINKTPWLELPWAPQPGQENWARRRIDNSAIEWINQWDSEILSLWPKIEEKISYKLQPYWGTAFWLDQPGFTCSMHTDGELPGSLHITWFGPATCFYWYKNSSSIRYQVPAAPNTGYIMINQADSSGYRKLLWHDMPTPVPVDSFRLTTYISLGIV
jgi:hypothetical protein